MVRVYVYSIMSRDVGRVIIITTPRKSFCVCERGRTHNNAHRNDDDEEKMKIIGIQMEKRTLVVVYIYYIPLSQACV